METRVNIYKDQREYIKDECLNLAGTVRAAVDQWIERREGIEIPPNGLKDALEEKRLMGKAEDDSTHAPPSVSSGTPRND